MNLVVIENSDIHLLLEFEGMNCRLRLSPENRWVSLFQVLLKSENGEGWEVHSLCHPHGIENSFTAVKEKLIEAVETNTHFTNDINLMWKEIVPIITLGETLKTGRNYNRMHDHAVADFLDNCIKEKRNRPDALIKVYQHYQESYDLYIKNEERDYYTYEINFNEDWIYQMAIDLIQRQLKPENCICVIVAMDVADNETGTAFYLHRISIDRVSNNFIHFFALSDFNHNPSENGKINLVHQLKEHNIEIKDYGPFLVFIEVAKDASGYFSADVLGTYFMGDMGEDEVWDLFYSMSKIARDTKYKSGSYDDFLKGFNRHIAIQDIKKGIGLFSNITEILQKATKFIK